MPLISPRALPTIINAVSQLPALAPLAAATLAANLAYLSLQRFRYRSEMREAASKELKQFGEAVQLPTSITSHDQYKELHYLAKLSNHDGKNTQKAAAVQRPKGVWAFMYFVLFEYHEDIVIVGLLTIFSIIILLGGVAHSINIWSWLLPYSHDGWTELWFWVLTLGTIAPASLVLLGRWVVRCGCARARHYGEQLGDLIKDLANRAAPPNTPEGGGNIPPAPVGGQGPAHVRRWIRHPDGTIKPG